MMRRIFVFWRFCKDGLEQAAISLADNRLRTWLSVLGVTVGVAAVMAVGTISQGGRRLIFDELETFGLRSVWVFRVNEDKKPDTPRRHGTGFENGDMDLMETSCCASVRRFSPVLQIKERQLLIRFASMYSNAQVVGVNQHYLEINNDRLTGGRFFDPDDIARRRNVAVIGPAVVADLFGVARDPVGKVLRIGDRKYTVVGVTEKKSRDFQYRVDWWTGQQQPNIDSLYLVTAATGQQAYPLHPCRVRHAGTRRCCGFGVDVFLRAQAPASLWLQVRHHGQVHRHGRKDIGRGVAHRPGGSLLVPAGRGIGHHERGQHLRPGAHSRNRSAQGRRRYPATYLVPVPHGIGSDQHAWWPARVAGRCAHWYRTRLADDVSVDAVLADGVVGFHGLCCGRIVVRIHSGQASSTIASSAGITL